MLEKISGNSSVEIDDKEMKACVFFIPFGLLFF